MATREEIGLALEVISLFNQMGVRLRSVATNIQASDIRIDVLLDGGEKQAKLVSGLLALNIDLTDLQNDKTLFSNIASYVLNNVPEIITV